MPWGESEEVRFWSKVNKTDGCWLWTGSTQRGYGQFSVGSVATGGYKSVRAHRWSYEHQRGPIFPGLQIDHLCRVRNCVNPDHLEPVTPQVNTLRGTAPTALNARKTHCFRGHEFTPENTVPANGGRNCKQCLKERKARRRERLRANKPDGRKINLPTECPSGHLYDEVNTYLRGNNARQCRECNRLRSIEWRKKQSAARKASA